MHRIILLALVLSLQTTAFVTPSEADTPPSTKTAAKADSKPPKDDKKQDREKHKIGTWEGKSQEGSNVKVKMKHGGVTVIVNKDKDHVPQSVGMTFYDENGKKTNVELQAVDPWSEPGSDTNAELASTQTQFAGSLSPANQSFVGFSLKIPFDGGDEHVIHSKDMKKKPEE